MVNKLARIMEIAMQVNLAKLDNELWGTPIAATEEEIRIRDIYYSLPPQIGMTPDVYANLVVSSIEQAGIDLSPYWSV